MTCVLHLKVKGVPACLFFTEWLLSGWCYLGDLFSLHSNQLLPEVSWPALPTSPAPNSHFSPPFNPFLPPVHLLSSYFRWSQPPWRPITASCCATSRGTGRRSPRRPGAGRRAVARQAANAEGRSRPPRSPRQCCGRSKSRDGWGRPAGPAPAPPLTPPTSPQPVPGTRTVAARPAGAAQCEQWRCRALRPALRQARVAARAGRRSRHACITF